jgi:hypothetical protein
MANKPEQSITEAATVFAIILTIPATLILWWSVYTYGANIHFLGFTPWGAEESSASRNFMLCFFLPVLAGIAFVSSWILAISILSVIQFTGFLTRKLRNRRT